MKYAKNHVQNIQNSSYFGAETGFTWRYQEVQRIIWRFQLLSITKMRLRRAIALLLEYTLNPRPHATWQNPGHTSCCNPALSLLIRNSTSLLKFSWHLKLKKLFANCSYSNNFRTFKKLRRTNPEKKNINYARETFRLYYNSNV